MFVVKLFWQRRRDQTVNIRISRTSILTNWDASNRKNFEFGVLMLWREGKTHASDCYFSIIRALGFNINNKKNIQYSDVAYL